MSVGSHAIIIDSDKGSVRRTVEVTSERATTVSETIFSGFLKVFAPFELSVSEAGRSLRLDDHSQLMLSPGVHDLRFENKDLAFFGTRKVEIEPGKTATITLTPGGSALSVTATAPAEVFVDGQRVGDHAGGRLSDRARHTRHRRQGCVRRAALHADHHHQAAPPRGRFLKA